MTHPLDYSTPSTPREKTDWRWRLALLAVLIVSAGVVVAMSYAVSKPAKLTAGMICGLPGIVLLSGPMVAVHCLIVQFTRGSDRQRQTQMLIGMPVTVACLLVGWSMLVNTNRQRFRDMVADPIPPSVMVERVVGHSGVDEAWVIVFQISPPDFQSLVQSQGLGAPVSPPHPMTIGEMEYYLKEPVPALEQMQQYGAGPGGGNVLRSVIYNPTTGQAYYLYTTF